MMNKSKMMNRIPRIALMCLMLGLLLESWFPEAVQAPGPYYAAKEEGVLHVPTHIEPKGCWVWKDGPDPEKPWRPIPGSGCAHWVAHELGLGIDSPWLKWEKGEIKSQLPAKAWIVCYDGFYINIADNLAGRTPHEIMDAEVGDIWTNDGINHTGIVRHVGLGEVYVEHDHSPGGGVVKDWFASGKAWKSANDSLSESVVTSPLSTSEAATSVGLISIFSLLVLKAFFNKKRKNDS